jgi:hypothetical protein
MYVTVCLHTYIHMYMHEPERFHDKYTYIHTHVHSWWQVSPKDQTMNSPIMMPSSSLPYKLGTFSYNPRSHGPSRAGHKFQCQLCQDSVPPGANGKFSWSPSTYTDGQGSGCQIQLSQNLVCGQDTTTYDTSTTQEVALRVW